MDRASCSDGQTEILPFRMQELTYRDGVCVASLAVGALGTWTYPEKVDTNLRGDSLLKLSG